MFSFLEFFQQKPYDVLTLLFIIHIGSLACAVLIQWILPYLTNRARDDEQVKTETNHVGDGDSCDDDFLEITDNLSSFINFSEISPKDIDCQLNDFMCSVKEAVLLRQNLENVLSEKRSQNEAHTMVSSVNSKVVIDERSLHLISSPRICTQKSRSYDRFESSSDTSDYVVDKPIQLFCDADSSELKKPNPLNDVQRKNDSTRKRKITADFADYLDYRRRIFKENKILETSISDLKKELAPIKDQIDVIKQSLNGYIDSSGSSTASPTSNTSFSADDIGNSKALTTIWSSDCTSLPQTPLEKKSPFVIKLNVNRLENSTVQKLIGIKNKKCLIPNRFFDVHKDNSSFRDLADSRQSKRSPIAEMYVKLSQMSLQRSNFSRQVKRTVSLTGDCNKVMCHINLNINLSNVSSDNIERLHHLKEKDLLPILSQMDDIISLKKYSLFK